MSYSNTTPNLKLPQILENDKPNWDIDMNEAFKNIDDFAGKVQDNQSEDDRKFDQVNIRVDDAEKRISDNEKAIAANGERITELQTDVEGLQTSSAKQSTDITEINQEIENLNNVTETTNTNLEQTDAKVDLNTDNINKIKDDLMPAGSEWVAGTRNKYFAPAGILPVKFVVSHNTEPYMLNLTVSTPFPDITMSNNFYFFDDMRGNSVSKYSTKPNYTAAWAKLLPRLNEMRTGWSNGFSLSTTYSDKNVVYELEYNNQEDSVGFTLDSIRVVAYFVDMIKFVYVDVPS